jgi:hypothetical protein
MVLKATKIPTTKSIDIDGRKFNFNLSSGRADANIVDPGLAKEVNARYGEGKGIIDDMVVLPVYEPNKKLFRVPQMPWKK